MAHLKRRLIKWTSHSKYKMRQYGLSESRVKRVLHAPKRIEYGIAPDTIAVMQPSSIRRSTKDGEVWNQEIWVMIAEAPKERRIISAWRYPGRTKIGEKLPAEILREIEECF